MKRLAPMTRHDRKIARVASANAVLVSVSTYGRRFFHDKGSDRVSKFKLHGGSLYLIDKYTEMPTAMRKGASWRRFSDGGTLRALVEALAGYIRTGKPISSRYFGPWPAHYCDGDLWGYGHLAMDAVRAEMWLSPAVAFENQGESND